MDDIIDPPDPGSDMVVDPEGLSESSFIPSPNPIREPPLPPLPLPLPPPPQLTQAGRPMRNYKRPARYIDINPEPLRTLDEEPPPPTSILPRVILIVRNRLRTATNSFNLLREYLYRPSFDPDSFVPPEDLLAGHEQMDAPPISPPTPPPVHRNQSIELLMNWKDSGPSTKSDGEVNRLVDEVLLDPKFKLEELRGFRTARENRRTDTADENSPFLDSFHTATVEIDVPSGSKDVPPAKFSIPGLRYRKIPAVIRAMFASPLASKFHLSPFKLFRKAPNGEEERVFCEVYDSDAFIEENDKIQAANVRRQWQPSCFGQTPPTWQTLEQPNSGPSTCSSEIFQNTFALYQTQALVSTSHTSPLFQILSKISPPDSIRNGERNRRI